MSAWRKLGIIAGGGELPLALAEHCAATGQDYFVARVGPFADAALAAHPGAEHDAGAMGARIAALSHAGCDAIVFIGRVPRMDLSLLRLDEGGAALMAEIRASALKGDDVLLRALVGAHSKAGFNIVGAEQVMAGLAATPGPWGAIAPSARDFADIKQAAEVAAAIGAYDVGQGVVACAGLVLAVEAQEGTDAMLARVGELPAAVRGLPQNRRGVLVKRPKPMQERRIDLPVIGVKTIEASAAAGLAGVAVEAGGVLAVRRAGLVAAADAAGLFVYGFTRTELGET